MAIRRSSDGCRVRWLDATPAEAPAVLPDAGRSPARFAGERQRWAAIPLTQDGDTLPKGWSDGAGGLDALIAGLRDALVRRIVVHTLLRNPDDYWLPFPSGQGPAPGTVEPVVGATNPAPRHNPPTPSNLQ